MKNTHNLWKKMTSLLLFIAIIGGISAMMPKSHASETKTLQRSRSSEDTASVSDAKSVSVYINGEEMESRGRLIDDTTYMPLRAMSEEIDTPTIGFEDGIANVNSRQLSMSVQQGSHYITANGRILYYGKPNKNIEGRLYVPIRTLAKAYSLQVEWNDETKSVNLYGDPKGLRHASEFYNSDDLYWLSRIINAESAGESLLGKIAVGNVVINRKNHKSYPNSLYGVIFDKKYGTQFTPVASGTIYKTPSAESILAAKICLDGYTLNSEMIFFINPKIATNFWITQTRTHVMTIGNHKFYK